MLRLLSGHTNRSNSRSPTDDNLCVPVHGTSGFVSRDTMTVKLDKDVAADAGYQRSLEVHRRIEALYPRIEECRAYFRAMRQVDRALPQPPGQTAGAQLDPIVCALAVKATTTKQAILALCELRNGDNAIILARVLLENA